MLVSTTMQLHAPAFAAFLTCLLPVIYIYRTFYRRGNSKCANMKPTSGADSAPGQRITPLQNFNWKEVEQERIRNFKPTYHISMGIKTDSPSQLLTIDQDYHHRVLHRRQLIKEFPNTVHGFVPGSESAVKELYTHLLSEYLPVRFQTMFEVSSDGSSFTNLVTATSYPTQPPIDTALALRNLGEIVEEDMFLLKPTSAGHRLVAYVCCFPSGFDPSEKLGKLLKDIHGPVPGYEKIGPSMERFFCKLEAGKPVKRTNWSVQTHPELFDCDANPSVKAHKASCPDVKIPDTFLRCELQTLSRLARSQNILFNFKTYQYNIADIKAEGRGNEFADAIEGLKKGNVPDMWKYKGAPKWAVDVCKYLR